MGVHVKLEFYLYTDLEVFEAYTQKFPAEVGY